MILLQNSRRKKKKGREHKTATGGNRSIDETPKRLRKNKKRERKKTRKNQKKKKEDKTVFDETDMTKVLCCVRSKMREGKKGGEVARGNGKGGVHLQSKKKLPMRTKEGRLGTNAGFGKTEKGVFKESERPTNGPKKKKEEEGKESFLSKRGEDLSFLVVLRKKGKKPFLKHRRKKIGHLPSVKNAFPFFLPQEIS